MPLTFSHPAAVLPIAARPSRWIHFPALVIGSMVPDLALYSMSFSTQSSHSAASLVVDVPLNGLCLLVLLYGTRSFVADLLPSPHREALLPLAKPLCCVLPAYVRNWQSGMMGLFVVVLSLVLGAATHIFWDGFTHSDGWAVSMLPALNQPVLSGLPWPGNLPWCEVLQHVSTVVGAAVLVWAYLRWLRRAPTADDNGVPFSSRTRTGIFIVVVAFSTIAVLPHALRAAGAYEGFFVLRVLCVCLVIKTVQLFFAGFLAMALTIGAWKALIRHR